MKVGSLFSGIGGFDLGLERAGFEVAFQCDNNPFCNKVLAKHWPGVPRYDDVRNIGLGSAQRDQQGKPHNGEAHQPDIARAGHVDLICGGFPCQDLSVAGKRAGLTGDRSGLWFEFHRILSELRPTFALIENVPGLLSSNEGRDFATVLDGLGQLWPAVGWAVLDSQHFGVPQRRRRVYVIAGPSKECVQQILSLCEGGDWHSQARREMGEGAAFGAPGGLAHSLSNVGGGNDYGANKGALAFALNSSQQRLDGSVETFITHTLSADGFDASEDGTGRGTPLITLNATFPTLSAQRGGPASQDWQQHAAVASGSTVRRLTPVECERLQGFPDNWTDIGDLRYRGPSFSNRGTADGPRYRALGNAVTVPVIEYLGHRIMAVLS